MCRLWRGFAELRLRRAAFALQRDREATLTRHERGTGARWRVTDAAATRLFSDGYAPLPPQVRAVTHHGRDPACAD